MGGGAGSAGAAGGGGADGGADGGAAGMAGMGGTGGADGGAAGTSGAGGSGGSEAIVDPALDGPFTTAELDANTTVASTGHAVPIHCVVPTGGPGAGPYPIVVFAHGFQIPASQYYGYIRKLGGFGYVALTADFPAGLLSVDNVANAKDLLGALDWAIAQSADGGSPLSGKVDPALVGMSGHSLGGKLSLLAATLDPRVKASITLDPVDTSAQGCAPANCPDVSASMSSLAIPTAFVGETTDATGTFQACAPAADNYATFYANAKPPSLEVTVQGANHMSFVDDPVSCGLVCSLCKPATAPHDQVIGLSYAYVVAFYERYLRGQAGYDDYLTGPTAQARYAGLAAIESK